MAKLVFSQAFRTANAGVAFTNTGSTTLAMEAFGTRLDPGKTMVIPFGEFDQWESNPRHEQHRALNVNGTPARTDMGNIAFFIANGQLTVAGATYNASTNAYTVGSTVAGTVATPPGDGSVFF